jgi:tetratricopeptide (TPR) repeat protein
MSLALSEARNAVEAAAGREDRVGLLVALRHLARVLQETGATDEADQIHEQVIQLDPSDLEALAALNRPPPPPLQRRGGGPRVGAREQGTGGNAVGEGEAAEGDETEADPELEVHIELGQTYIAMEIYGEALDRFEEVFTRAPNLGPGPIPWRVRAALLPLFQEGSQHAWPEDEWCRICYLLGRTEEALGNCPSAREFYREVAARDLTFKDVAQRLHMLKP